MLYCSINGQETNQIDVRDRALQYGDGIFTTALIRQGNVLLVDKHLNRLLDGCQSMNIAIDTKQLEASILKCASAFNQAVLKVTISAGSGGRGYSRIGVSEPTVIIQIFEYPKHYELWQSNGIDLGVAKQKLGHSSVLPGVKHLNRLEQVFIRQELDTLTVDDVLVLDISDRVIEVSSGNVFWCIDQQWFTAAITNAGVSGLMREFILEKVPSVAEVSVGLAELTSVEAMVVSNSVMQMAPVKSFEQRSLDVELAKSFINLVKTGCNDSI